EAQVPASFWEYDLQKQKRPGMFAGLAQSSALAPAMKTRAKMWNVYSSEGIVTSTSGTSMVFSSVPTSTSAVSTSISGKSPASPATSTSREGISPSSFMLASHAVSASPVARIAAIENLFIITPVVDLKETPTEN